MKIKFCGATQHVTGSNYWLETDKQEQFLIDCGLFQGARIQEDFNFKPLLYDPSKIKNLILTHAHLDHCGRIPKLFAEGFNGSIYATEPTHDLTRIVLEDAVGLMQEESERDNDEPLYIANDVQRSFQRWNYLNYHQEEKIGQGITIKLYDDGHILGSASVQVKTENKIIVFSGDIGNPPVPFLRPTEAIKETDYLVIESTYGGIIHEPPQERLSKLQKAITDTISAGGTLMIPAFAVERAQELLYEINELVENKKIPQVPVFLDSPMAIKVTKVFRHFKEYYNSVDKLQSYREDLMHFPGLQMTESVEASKKINDVKGAKVIIAGSGMMHGGRILHHAKRYLSDPNSALLIVGFQVEGSLGRRLYDGERKVTIHGEKINVKAKIKAIGAYSAHADQNGLLHFIDVMDKKPQKIFITHGELTQSQALSEKIKEKFKIECVIPKFGDEHNL